MFTKVNSAHILGIDGIGIDVEVDVSSNGMPSFTVVGLAEGALKESKERVRATLKNLGYNIFAKPITINLAPADFKKEGTHYDLPIAVGLLIASERLENIDVSDTLILGELGLDGCLRGISGVLPMVEYAKLKGLKKVFLPNDNAEEAVLIPDIDIYSFKDLAEVIAYLRKDATYKPYLAKSVEDNSNYDNTYDFSDVKGQFVVRRAAEIASAGMHNIILIGSPGSGKTMIAKRIPTILPPMSIEESLQTTKIYSVAGLIKQSGKLINTRPFVSPHHTASNIAIIGGGSKAKPGNVSIANGGVLFLDEMLEFNRNVLEVLRQPLEDKVVTIARAGRTITYPANFMLVGAMNPCPCGYYGDKQRACTCSLQTVERYKSRLSGPLIDRIDLVVNVSSVEHSDLINMKNGEKSSDIRGRVSSAHKIQQERFKDKNYCFNSQMTERDVSLHCVLDKKAENILQMALKKYMLSARAYSKILKTSRTIADLSGAKEIESSHILEALQFRLLERDG